VESLARQGRFFVVKIPLDNSTTIKRKGKPSMPLVSVIIPCYNEQATIRLLLDAIYQQTVSSADIEVVIADGRSTDQTRAEVARFQNERKDMVVKVIDNPRRNIPAALNSALDAACGTYVVRLDAHSVPAPDYIERCVEALTAGQGENVGGVWEVRPLGSGLVQRAIAVAASHPFGVGDALYRYTTQAGYVDTVPFGSFRRDVFTRYGKFDESLLTNEDYEFNARLRQQGGRVWLDPRIRSTYFARGSFKTLAQQYWRYGFWKWRMLRRYPQTLRWRQALPPVFVLGLVFGTLLGLFWQPAFALLAVALVMYGLVLAAGAWRAARQQGDLRLVVVVPLAIACMHLSWGSGFCGVY
jgi:succinoglycan biosynthesis protein ExoA